MLLLYFWLGLSISFSAFKNIDKEWKGMLIVIFLQLLIIPFIGLIFAFKLAQGMNRDILILLAMAPGGITGAIAARIMKLDITVNVVFSSLTTLLYLLIIQPFILPIFVTTVPKTNDSFLPFLFSFMILFAGVLIHHFFKKLSQFLDKVISIIILVSIIVTIYANFKTSVNFDWQMLLPLFWLHISIVLVSGIIASIFLNVKRAPLIVLETGYHNITLITAMLLAHGLPVELPIMYGILMILSTTIMIINVRLIRKCKPRFFITRFVIPPYKIMTIPPFGIFIKSEYANNKTLQKNPLIHFKQYKELGTLGYYIRSLYEALRFKNKK